MGMLTLQLFQYQHGPHMPAAFFVQNLQKWHLASNIFVYNLHRVHNDRQPMNKVVLILNNLVTVNRTVTFLKM